MKLEKETPNFLKSKTISYLGGPILFTAPHSKKLIRGGKEFNEKERIHLRELHTAWISCKLAMLTNKSKKYEANSFIVWGKSSVVDEKDLDPNYLKQNMLMESPFHQGLHAWALMHEGQPILHVDIHGKNNREKNCEIDVGIRSMEVHWENNPLIQQIHNYFNKEMNHIFKNMKFRNFECVFNTDPYLHGYWGCEIMTMTEQAILLGIPSLQLEIPHEIRDVLSKKPQLMEALAEGILKFYTNVIAAPGREKVKPLKLQKCIGEKYSFAIKNGKDLNEASEQIKKMEEKEAMSYNTKKI